MKKHALAQEAIEAAVDAIEANGYRLVLPLKFDVTHVAMEKKAPSSPRYISKPESTAAAALNETAEKKKKTGS